MIKEIIGLILSALLLASSFPAQAQQTGKSPRIGVLGDAPSSFWDVFRQGLRKIGYGKNIVKTAEKIGLTIPPNVLGRADRVIK